MEDVGKVDHRFLEETVFDRLGADRSDVVLGPGHGLDFGVVDVGDQVLALATDPLFVPLELGVERAAWYGVHVVLSDVALSGLAPSHLAVTVTLPAGADMEEFADVWMVLHEEAQALGVAVTAGHTGRYEGCAYPYIGGATAMAVGDGSDVVYPSGASPGDVVVVTKGPAVETVGVLATRFGDVLDVSPAALAAARDRFWEISVVPDARAAAATGRVTAMHDATERGVDNAVHELARAADIQLVLDRDQFPIGEGVTAVCEAVGIDPWSASSEGTVVLTVEPGGVEVVLDAFDAAGIRAAPVGEVREGQGVIVDGEALSEPTSDPFWAAYTSLGTEDGDRRD